VEDDDLVDRVMKRQKAAEELAAASIRAETRIWRDACYRMLNTLRVNLPALVHHCEDQFRIVEFRSGDSARMTVGWVLRTWNEPWGPRNSITWSHFLLRDGQLAHGEDPYGYRPDGPPPAVKVLPDASFAEHLAALYRSHRAGDVLAAISGLCQRAQLAQPEFPGPYPPAPGPLGGIQQTVFRE
jgi:hypothetical protein